MALQHTSIPANFEDLGEIIPLSKCTRLPFTWPVLAAPLGWDQSGIQFCDDQFIPKSVEQFVDIIEAVQDKSEGLHREWSLYLLAAVAIKLNSPQIWQTLGDCLHAAVATKWIDQRHITALLGIPARAARGEMSWETCEKLLSQIDQYHKTNVILDRVEMFQEFINSFVPPYNIDSKHAQEYVRAANYAWAAVADKPPSTASFGIRALGRALEELKVQASHLSPHSPSEFRAFRNVIKTGLKLAKDTSRNPAPGYDYTMLDGTVMDVAIQVGFKGNHFRFITDSTSALESAQGVLQEALKLIAHGTAGDYSIPLALLHQEVNRFFKDRSEHKSFIARKLGMSRKDVPKSLLKVPKDMMSVYVSLLSAYTESPKHKPELPTIAQSLTEILDRVSIELPQSWKRGAQDLFVRLNRPLDTGDFIPWMNVAPNILEYLIQQSKVRRDFPSRGMKRLTALLKGTFETGGNIEAYFDMELLLANSTLTDSQALTVTKRAIVNRVNFTNSASYSESSPHITEKFNLLAETFYSLASNNILTRTNSELLQTLIFSHSTADKSAELVHFTLGRLLQGEDPGSGTASLLSYIESKLPVHDQNGLFALDKALQCAEHCSATLLRGYPSPIELREEIAFIRDRLPLLDNQLVSTTLEEWFRGILTYEDLGKYLPHIAPVVCDLATTYERKSFINNTASNGTIERIERTHNLLPYWPNNNSSIDLHLTPKSVSLDVRALQAQFNSIQQEYSAILWENTLPLGMPAKKPTLQEMFGKIASRSYVPLHSEDSSGAPAKVSYGTKGGLFKLFDVEKVWCSFLPEKPLLEEYGERWAKYRGILSEFVNSAIFRTTDFIQIIPPNYDIDPSEGDKFRLFDTTYGAISFFGDKNPLNLGTFLVPRKVLLSMWVRNGKGCKLRPEITSSTSALKFLLRSDYPILNLSSGLAIAGLHKLAPPGKGIFDWEPQANTTTSRSDRDSAGHYPVPISTRKSSAHPRSFAPIPFTALKQIPELHTQIYKVGINNYGLYDLFRLSNMRFFKGYVSDGTIGKKASIAQLEYAYHFHKQHKVGLLPKSAFPILSLNYTLVPQHRYGPITGQEGRLELTLDTYDLSIKVKEKAVQLETEVIQLETEVKGPDKRAYSEWYSCFIKPILANDAATIRFIARADE